MSTPIKQSGRVSPNSYYKNKRIQQTLEKKEKEKRENEEKNGRQSPTKFVFTLHDTTQSSTQSSTHSTQSITQSSKYSTRLPPNPPPSYKSKNIKPVLTLQELETTNNISVPSKPRTPATLPINIPNSRNRYKYKYNSSSNYNSTDNSSDNSPINSPPHIIDLLIDNIIAEGKEVVEDEELNKDINKDINKYVNKQLVEEVKKVMEIPEVPEKIPEVAPEIKKPSVVILQKNKSFNKYQYYAHLKIINTIKHLVFQNKGLICGSFNSHQLTINEYTKSFMNQIKIYNNSISTSISTSNSIVNFTDDEINDLFVDELVLPETKERLNLQSSIEILISYTNFINFINNMKQYFNTEFSTKTYYKLEYINKGNMKDNIDKTNDLYLYNENGNQIYINIVKIFEQIYNISFEVKFIVLYNDNLDYEIPLYIPIGLYQSEHLHITNNGQDILNIQYSSSSLTFVVNNINMKIVSLFPKLNDYDYTKISKYIFQIMSCHNDYLFEFDIYNTIHKKSDFWLCKVQNGKESKIGTTLDTAIDSASDKSHGLSNALSNSLYCNKCSIVISKNTKYVIAKCCHKEYHIECMEMNYYQIDYYTYLVCDCGCNIIDEKSCNNRLLLALYKNYY